MTALRIGCDIVDPARLATALQRAGAGFAASLFNAAEQQRAATDPLQLAAVFAVKEATLKAIGIGLAQGAVLTDIDVMLDDVDCARVTLSGALARIAGTRFAASRCRTSHGHIEAQAWLLPAEASQ